TFVRGEDGGERFIPKAAFAPDGAVRIAGILTVGERLGGAWGWVVAALAAMCFQSPIGAVRWQLLLSVQGIRITFWESLRLTYIGWFFNNWMPGSTGGDFVKAYYIARRTHQKTEAVTVVFLDRFIGLVAMCMLGAAAIAVSLQDERLRMAQVIVGAFLGAVVVGGTIFYSRSLRRILGVDWILSLLPLRETVARVDHAIFVYRYHKGKIVLAMAYSWLAQVVSVLAVWWLATALGSGASWDAYFVSMPVVWIGWSLIPVPGGVGVAEALAQKLFGPAVVGMGGSAVDAATLALAMMLAYRLVQLVVSLPGAVFYLARRTDVSPLAMRQKMESETPDA
ncbi:MAG: lysylphosphatidylglycerol synthase transmembrane domain-containing protein, partial [Planctomycetota bacterium]|nr:lysylphosphatidylglycerol synthase transmembrane domain-containing protein [Planctomycetota bacterium]